MIRAAILVATAVLAGCDTMPRIPNTPQVPPIPAHLATPCDIPQPPPEVLGDYDATDAWLLDALLPALADCALKVRGLQQAWPK